MVAENRLQVAKNGEPNRGIRKCHSIPGTADWLGVSVGHVRNLIKRGDLRAIKSGRRILIMDEDLRRYIEEHVVETGA